jgi:class 3 adenylate cyclase
MASRLESLGTPGRIHICPGCRQVLDGAYGFESRGLIEVKGLGPVETWYLTARAYPDGGAGGICPGASP